MEKQRNIATIHYFIMYSEKEMQITNKYKIKIQQEQNIQ
jgi:hypothetical protein